jgi:integrase
MNTQAADIGPRPNRRRLPSRKVVPIPIGGPDAADSIEDWVSRYLDAAIHGVRSDEVTAKIALHLGRFREHFADTQGHERLSAVIRREVVAWREHLATTPDDGGLGLAPATVNAHLASLSGFTTWVCAHDPAALPHGNPCAKVRDLPLPPLEPRALTPGQVRTLKNLLDRLDRFHQHKGRRRNASASGMHGHARPWRDRAIVYLLLATGLRREELVRIDLAQLAPNAIEALRAAKRAKLTGVRGKGRTQRNVYLSADARTALADYVEHERPADAGPETSALFLSAASIGSRRPDGRLSPRSINTICEQIGRWHDAEQPDPARQIAPLRPHDLRHTFAFALAAETGNDGYELQRRLGHASQRYISRYTNPPEDIAASYIERL